jgi:hypothetical protein
MVVWQNDANCLERVSVVFRADAEIGQGLAAVDWTATLGSKDRWALGRPASEVWAELRDDIGPRIATVMSAGEATWDEALRLLRERSGYPEETYGG